MTITAPPLSLAEVQRYARHLPLPEIGVAGQGRITRSRALVVAPGKAAHAGASAAVDYLVAAGMQQVVLSEFPPSADASLEALQGMSLVICFGLDDHPLLSMAVRAGIPLLGVRSGSQGVDLLAFRRHGPCPHRELPPARPINAQPSSPEDSAAAVLAATLAASEALLLLAAPDAGPRARLLRLPLDGSAPSQATLPWSPECFLCGGQQQSASFT